VSTKAITIALLTALSMLTAECGRADQGRSPSQVTITTFRARSQTSSTLVDFLLSDVITNGSVFDDVGVVTMTLHLKDPGAPGVTSAPSALNEVTFTRYHVVYRRSDGLNTPGVDVPFAFDSATTFTVTTQGGAGTFELVRHVAKVDAPLAALVSNRVVITTIADVTFYGKDQAGNNVAVTGSIQVSFGNFADS
jgi:hypothetical protein